MTSGHPLVIAHRGASASAEDNTLAAYALAVAQDADGIELDIRLTADGSMVLHHDAWLADGTPIVDLQFEELREHHPHVPTPDEMLAVAGDLLLDLELKNSPTDPDFDPDHGVAELVVAWIRRHELEGRALVSSFNWMTTARVRSLGDDLTTGQLVQGPFAVAGLVESIAADGHTWVLPGDGMLGDDPADTITAAHGAGLRLGVWTVDDPIRMTTLADVGIDAIVTNDPALAVTTLT